MNKAKKKALKVLTYWTPRDSDTFSFPIIDGAIDVAIKEAKKEVFDDIEKTFNSVPYMKGYKPLKERHLNTLNTEKKKHYNIGLRSPITEQTKEGD